jgi:hypothetical protein
MTTPSEAAAILGRKGGQSKSARKQAASRANGAKANQKANTNPNPAPVEQQPTLPQVHVFTATTPKES